MLFIDMDWKAKLVVLLVMALLHQAFSDEAEAEDDQDHGGPGHRQKRIISMFSTIRFRNGPCRGSDGLNGTCYTQPECSSRGGTNSGSCAAGLGVCCTFTMGCGGRSNQNCTYFTAAATANTQSGACTLKVCPCNSNICQLRLDFINFAITGPSSDTASSVKILNGQVLPMASKSATTATQCLTDSFSVTSDQGCAPPTICGINTGEHMYVDASSACNDLTFQLGTAGVGVDAVATRSWNIKVTQYSCDYNNLAPDCCTQYFFGSTVGNVMSYNFAGGSHLANQNQNICIRRERNICRICWTTQNDIDFQLSGMTTKMAGLVNKGCCSYGSKGTSSSGFDCVQIAGASKFTTKSSKIAGSKFCGRSKGLGTPSSTATANTVCTRQTPFSLSFISDNFEFGGAAPMEATNQDRGFMLTYIQQNC